MVNFDGDDLDPKVIPLELMITPLCGKDELYDAALVFVEVGQNKRQPAPATAHDTNPAPRP